MIIPLCNILVSLYTIGVESRTMSLHLKFLSIILFLFQRDIFIVQYQKFSFLVFDESRYSKPIKPNIFITGHLKIGNSCRLRFPLGIYNSMTL